MTSKNPRKSVPLNIIVGAAIVVWAGTFASVYGPFVFAYVGMHAVTTGVFLLAIRRADRRHARVATQPVLSTAASPIKRTVSERRTSPQPAA